MESTIKADFRLLVLVISLAKQPLTREEIFQLVPGYYQSDLNASERMFERDKTVLKDLQIQLNVGKNRLGETTYRVEFPQMWLHLTAEERSLLQAASALWSEADDWGSYLELFKFKVSAYALENPASVRALVKGGRLAVQLLTAIEAKQVISFKYHKRDCGKFTDRLIYPIRIVFEAGALFAYGFDFDRLELRMFRLQRFYPDSVTCCGVLTPQQLNAISAVYQSVGELEKTAREMVFPRLWVRKDYLEQARWWLLSVGSEKRSFRDYSTDFPADSPENFPEGGDEFFLCIGQSAPFSTWIERVMSAPDRIVAADEPLISLIYERLQVGTRLGRIDSGY